MLDQPAVAGGTLQPEPAGAAQGQRRVAAAVEEQERLLAACDRVADRLHEPRRDEASARWPFPAQVDRLDRRQMLAAEAFRQRELAVAAAPRVDLGFDRWRCRGEHDRDRGDMAAYDRHVARVVTHAVFLFVGRVVLLIDDDEAEVGERQKQGRARADDRLDVAGRDRRPGARAPARRKLGVPFRRTHAEARGEAVEKLRGERDLRHQDQRLAPASQDFGDRLKINLGLARAGDAVDQSDRIAARRHGRP